MDIWSFFREKNNIMKKIIYCFLGLFCLLTFQADALSIPALSNILSLKIYILPEQLNKEILFTFFKKDSNGRAGADALAFAVYSPSGKSVFEYSIPDDGETGNQWKPGPRQKAEVRFIPREKGVYTLQFKMSCDAYLYFDNNEVKNCHIGLSNSNFRTGGPHTPAHLYFYLPVNKVGESGIVDISSSYMHYNQISNMNITGGGKVFYKNFTAAPAPNKTKIFAHHFLIDRKNPHTLYELQASKFSVIDFVPKLYPQLTFFFSKKGAEAFKPYLFKSNTSPNSIIISATDAAIPFALGAGESYCIKYIPGKKEKQFKFSADILGKKYTFDNKKNTILFNAPHDNCFPSIKTVPQADGKFSITRVVEKRTTIESPADAEIISPVDGKIHIKALEVKKAKKYIFNLVHERGKKIQLISNIPETSGEAAELIPGVWQVSCTTDRDIVPGPPSYFAIKNPAKTSPIFMHGYIPAMDSSVKSVKEISLTSPVKLSDAIDFTKSTFTVSGKKYQVKALDGNRVGIPGEGLQLNNGKIDIQADIYDRDGNFSHYEWCFMLNADIRKTISFNSDGIMILNGRKFLPLICYPPEIIKTDDSGFNTVLPNTLTPLPALDIYLKQNLKSLDSGCVFRGFYTAADSTPLLDVERYLQGQGGRHPARIGAWLDEADAHVSDEYTRETLSGYQKFTTNSGVVGVCTTGSNRYADMAKMGDYLMIDVYPRENVLSLDIYFAQAMNDAAGKPVWQLNQGFDFDYSNRNPATMIPDPTMLRYAHWAAFRHGLQGLGLYMCGGSRYCLYPSMWQHVVELYRQAATLNFVLVEPTVTESIISTKSPYLKSRILRYRNRYYLIIQNASNNSIAAKIKVKGDFDPRVRVLFENRIVQLDRNCFYDVFQPLDSRIFELIK